MLPALNTSEIEGIDTARVFDNESAMRLRTPALFATSPHPRMSAKYSFTNTYEIVKHIHAKGFKVSSVQGGNKPHAAVMIRMRNSVYDMRDRAPEVCLLDSHDGTKRLKLFLGMLEFVCMNGMVAGDVLYARSFTHIAPDLMEQVILELEDIEQHIDKLRQRVERMRAHVTNIGERIALADAAVQQRFGSERDVSFVADMRQRMLQIRRSTDDGKDLYTVMNVIQENALRGGMFYNTRHTMRRVNPVNNVGKNININQVLWSTAEQIVAKAA